MTTPDVDLPPPQPDNELAKPTGEAITARSNVEKWLEWVVIALVIIGIAVASISSLTMVNGRLDGLDSTIKQVLATGACHIAGDSVPSPAGENPADHYQGARLATLSCLEEQAIQHRYAASALSIESRIWTRYFACVAGFLMIATGSTFIIMRVRHGPYEMEAAAKGINLSLKSASPGLAITLFGVVILLAAETVPGQSDTVDAPSYVSESFATTPSDQPVKLSKDKESRPEQKNKDMENKGNGEIDKIFGGKK